VTDLIKLGVPPWNLALRSVVVYAGLLLALRLFGKREVGQFTVYDLVFILLVANALQPAMTGPDTSLLGGMIIIVTLVVINFGVGRLDSLSWFQRLFSAEPTIIISHGQYLDSAIRRQGVNREEADTAIREHGLESVKDVRLGVLEPDGTISIVPVDSNISRTKRRVRFLRHG
jgi:uncharacterized membrane protein YcaP (DUF421 family)